MWLAYVCLYCLIFPSIVVCYIQKFGTVLVGYSMCLAIILISWFLKILLFMIDWLTADLNECRMSVRRYNHASGKRRRRRRQRRRRHSGRVIICTFPCDTSAAPWARSWKSTSRSTTHSCRGISGNRQQIPPREQSRNDWFCPSSEKFLVRVVKEGFSSYVAKSNLSTTLFTVRTLLKYSSPVI